MKNLPRLCRRIIRTFTLAFFSLCLLSIPAFCQPVIPTNTFPALDSWSFNDTNAWTSDRGYNPVSFTNLDVSYIGDGTSLVVDSTNGAWLQYNVFETNGATNLTVDEGSVLLWFAPSWASTNQGGSGPGVAGRLIEAGSYTADASYGWWSIFVDSDGANLYFAAQTNDGTGATYLAYPISWTSNYFHQIAVTYSSTNSTLFLDGELATNGPGVTIYPDSDVLTNGFWIGSDSNGVLQAHGIFDDLSTYTNQLDCDAVASDYNGLGIYYYLNPVNAAIFSSAPSSPPNPTGMYEIVSGPGYLQAVSTNTTSCVSSNDVWLTNAVATAGTNGSVNLTFTIAGGYSGYPYDVFATTTLTQPLNKSVWSWMGQGFQCVTYTMTGLTNSHVFLILGTPQDSDSDGLTDAYELLVTHSNPNSPDSFGDGISDGWKVLAGLSLNSSIPLPSLTSITVPTCPVP